MVAHVESEVPQGVQHRLEKALLGGTHGSVEYDEEVDV